MATLQKIRNRGVFIGIIIGGALLAFIAGDALKSGGSLLTNSRNEMAEIAGESVNIRDFQNRFNHNLEVTKMMGGQNSIPSDQMDKIREQVWQQMVQEIVMNREYDELGISISSDELFDMVQGRNIDPTIRQIFQNENGLVDKDQVRATLKQLMAAPDGTPQKAYWLNIEESLIAQRTLTKYNTLIAKGLYMPSAMIKEMATKGSKKVDFNYIVKSYNLIPDSTITVTESEIREYYNDNKELFKQGESRKIDYVPFSIEPSTDDFKYTEKWIADQKEDFAKESNNVQFVELNGDTDFNAYYFKKDEMSNKEVNDFAFAAAKGDVFGPYDENDAYKLAKIADVKMMADSVKARHILIRPLNGDFKAAEAKADSLKQLINKGAKFAEVAKANSEDQGSAVNGGDLGWFTQGRMVPEFNDAAFSSKKNEIKIVTTQFGAHLIQVVNLSKPVKKVQIAVLDRKVEASTKTTQGVYARARTFAGNNIERAAFLKAITAENLSRRTANLKKDTKLIPGLENSRDLVRAAYNTDEMESVLLTHDNSAVFEFGNKFVVAILSNIKEEGYASIQDQVSAIKRAVRKEKKAEQIIAAMNKNSASAQSLLSVAQKENLEVKNAADVSFQSFQIPGAGIEPKVISTAALLEKGKISSAIEGNQGVYMLVVTNETSDEVTDMTVEAFKSRLEQGYQYRANYQAFQALKENANVVDKRYKFY
ncbi:SurA N-terminal domain-containing protein [Labilibaculum sp. DW002]|uniref:Periplasmic chaperone PpiD n=1 Tax=Paralabilibaculum antarcticum TaxID=2912572 RepID=A0ABT5VXS3_9BACT|nr:peptidylprolyl isomerase [Labilibaculum sp. DW002]MDE5420107.1 SurA N-terminal domain-containing protein [Labilibaculum sp. DW002]